MHTVFMFGATIVVLAFAGSVNAQGKFSGNLSFHPTGCEATRKCFLDGAFDYRDSHGKSWEAQKGDKTDGASIPDWAQPEIGLPFDPSFIRAAVIHDHYCDRHVRPMRETHWMFYDALLTSHVSSTKAKIMWAAILIGGPKWISLVPGKPCTEGKMCIQSVTKLQLPIDAYVTTADDARTVVARGPQYDKPDVKAAIEEMRQQIEVNPKGVTEKEILAKAEEIPENKFFFDNLDGVAVKPPSNEIKK
jgi:Protein of unknown function (DUF1353)